MAKKAAYIALVAITSVFFLSGCKTTRQSQQSNSGPAGWIVDEENGCKVWNPNPKPNEKVSWTGNCANGIAEGKGILVWFKNGKFNQQQEGTFKDGKMVEGKNSNTPQSRWTADSKNNCKVWNQSPQEGETVTWTGECRNQIADGKGTASWFINGELNQKYEGPLVDGKREGHGKYYWKDGTVYTGQFKDDKQNGRGVMVWTDAGKNCGQDLCLKKYDGNWVNGVRDGHGSAEFHNGDSYEGQFSNSAVVGETKRNRSSPQEREAVRSRLAQAVGDDSTNWSFNRYDSGSLNFEKVYARHANGRIHLARARYSFNGGAVGWVDGRYDAGGALECIVFHDFPNTCRSPRSRSVASSSGGGGSNTCFLIRDKDEMNACLAGTRNDSNTCFLIKSKDLQNSCLAQVKRDRNTCFLIQSSDMKNECLALISGNQTDCFLIRSSDMQNACIAQNSKERSRCFTVRNEDGRNACLANF